MGVAWPDISFLLAARDLGVSFERTLTIGRQTLFATPPEILNAHRDAGHSLEPAVAQTLAQSPDGFAEPLFELLGANQVDSVDNSAYEGSTIVHDFNLALPEGLRGRYSVVFDGGSLEHVFNLPQALKNCMQAVAPGGHFITITPAASLMGHGFYQFSPELFYRALTPENGFEVVTLLVRSNHRWAHWRSVVDPAKVGCRVTMESPWQTLMFVLARRTADIEPFATWPQQSDYVTVWDGGARVMTQRLRGRLVARLPTPLRRAVTATRAATAVLGTTSGPNHFQRVAMVDVAQGTTQRG